MNKFDWSTFTPDPKAATKRYEPLPAGWHKVFIADAGMHENSKKTGRYLKLELEVTGDEQHNGRKLWDYLNLENPNEQAVQIARDTLGELLSAIGKSSVSSEAALIGQICMCKVKIEKRDGDTQNRVQGYKPTPAMEAERAPEHKLTTGGRVVGGVELPGAKEPRTTQQALIQNDDIPF